MVKPVRPYKVQHFGITGHTYVASDGLKFRRTLKIRWTVVGSVSVNIPTQWTISTRPVMRGALGDGGTGGGGYKRRIGVQYD